MRPQAPDQPRMATGMLLRLSLILVAMLALYAVLTFDFWLPALVDRSRVTIGTLTNRSLVGALQLGLAGIILHALYISGAFLLWRTPYQPRVARLVWLGALGMALLLLLAYPVTSTDIFDYIFRGRMAVDYGANPYLVLPNQFKSDPLYRYVGWPNAPSAYGPLWEYVSWVLVWLGGASLLRAVLLYKALVIAAFFACGGIIHLFVRDPQQRLLGVYLWLWSPLALWEIAAIGHNDSLLVLSLLLALWAVQHERYALAVLALVGGALFKFLPAIFLPLVGLAWLRRQPTWPRRFRVCVLAFVLCALPTLLLYAPYWDLPAQFTRLPFNDQLQAIWQGRTRTLRNVAVREGFLNASPLAVLSYQLQEPGSVTWINQFGARLELPAAGKTDVRAAVSAFGSGLLLLGIVWQSWWVWYRRRPLQVAFLALLIWYILAGSQWFQPWYVLWLLGVFALQPRRTTFGWLAAWALMAQASYLLQYIVLPNLKLSGQTLQAQVYYLVLIYPVPLIVWMLASYWPSQRPAQPRATEQPLTPHTEA